MARCWYSVSFHRACWHALPITSTYKCAWHFHCTNLSDLARLQPHLHVPRISPNFWVHSWCCRIFFNEISDSIATSLIVLSSSVFVERHEKIDALLTDKKLALEIPKWHIGNTASSTSHRVQTWSSSKGSGVFFNRRRRHRRVPEKSIPINKDFRKCCTS